MTEAAFRARDVWTGRHRGASRVTKLNIGGGLTRAPIGRFSHPNSGVAHGGARELVGPASGHPPVRLLALSGNPHRLLAEAAAAGAETENRGACTLPVNRERP